MMKIKLFSDNRGSTLISSLIAMGLIVGAIWSVALATTYFGRSMRKAEATNFAVMTEANIVNAFQSKINFPESLNIRLRSGALGSNSSDLFPLSVAFKTLADGSEVSTLISVPLGGALGPGAVGYLDRNLDACQGFQSRDCILRYEIRMQRSGLNYAFSYQIDTNPEVVQMTSLGSAKAFNSPVDPGLYRVDIAGSTCDPGNDLFMTGINRNTGEAFCAEKPKANEECPDKTLPKGLVYQEYQGNSKSGILKLKCTSAPMRTIRCPDNYALNSFNPQYADPDNVNFEGQIGACVFRTAHEAHMQDPYPPFSDSTYMKKVSGIFCPPFYKAVSGECNLVPNTSKNLSASGGMGKCGTPKKKGCTRATWTQTWVSGSPGSWRIDCSATETSTYCNGVPNTPSNCVTKGTWSDGTPYADNIKEVQPLASVVTKADGRTFECTYVDNSTDCTAPEVDFNGATYGMRDPVWYGGVRITDVKCVFDPNYDPAQSGAEVVNAIGGQ